MTKYKKRKFKNKKIFFPENIQGNLNNSSLNIGYIKNYNNRMQISYYNKRTHMLYSKFKFIRQINLNLYMSYSYTTESSKVSPKLVTEFVNEYNKDCFIISVFKDKKYKLDEGVSLIFKISLGSSCEEVERLINNFPGIFGCGLLVRKKDSLNYTVKDFLNINEKIIPFFNKHLLQGTKFEAFEH